MTTSRAIVFFVLLTASLTSFATEKVVYGEDDRVDVYESTSSLHRLLAQSTAAMIPAYKLTSNEENNDLMNLSGNTLEARGICESARFASQKTAASCSGFLVGKDLLVTAGHCMKSMSKCTDNVWVFDFKTTYENDQIDTIPTKNIYECVEILDQKLDGASKDDYALIRLKRVVTDRAPLNFRRDGRVMTGANLVVIGHPTGLPSKIATGAHVRGNSNDVFFVANLDTFAGNSGSAVFDANTGLVEGILVRGENDYVYDNDLQCKLPQQCTDEGCRGEDVTRITNISLLMEISNDK